MKIILPKTSDARFVRLACLAREDGAEVLEYTDPPCTEKAVHVLSLGADEAEILKTLQHASPGSVVLTGRAAPALREYAREKKICLRALLEEERYLIQNSIITAEGVLAELIRNTDRRLSEQCLLVYGYGNCGQEIAKLLWLCGCEVWVWSRERGQRLARYDGFNVYHAPTLGLGMFDGVINTVPAPVFPLSHLSTLRSGSFFFQVASGFSGICPEEAEQLGIRFYPLHGLPGKFAPASEADAIWEIIQDTLKNKPKRSNS